MDAGRGSAYQVACTVEGTPSHAKLVKEAEAELVAEEDADAEEAINSSNEQLIRR